MKDHPNDVRTYIPCRRARQEYSGVIKSQQQLQNKLFGGASSFGDAKLVSVVVIGLLLVVRRYGFVKLVLL